MKFSLDSAPGSLTIAAYAKDTVTISGQVHRFPLVVTPGGIHANLLPESLSSLTAAHLQAIADLGIEILILGTGSRQVLVGRELNETLAQRGVGLEAMNSPAACRCFNVLVAENRAVAAALFGD
ncbi:MAG: hypothetical protein FJ164_10495 [Gammaproteobacteria bacterium]|nr:hypothetical protein [Gammaproteobacteria bacterium]